MSWFDLAILLIIGCFAFLGYRRGLVGQLFGLAGVIVALVVAFTYFGQVGELLAGFLPVGSEIGGILGFILIVALVNAAFGLASSRWRALTKSSTLSRLDAVAGAVFGGLKAVLILVVVIVVLVSLPIPALRQRVEDAPLAAQILRTAPFFYLIQERSLPPNVPRLLITSQGVQLKRINLAELNGAMCLACRHRVRYEGFIRKGLLSYPRFVCTNPQCGLVSDGCLTYEGYHLIYGECPLVKANKGQNLNCQVWPSAIGVVPKGPCPVCGIR